MSRQQLKLTTHREARKIRSMSKTITFLLGPTCSGKSTICDRASAKNRAYPVQVGKLMRAKYPPEFFQGQGAPAHTQVEAQRMMEDGISQGFSLRYDNILVDGQPRTADHVKECLNIAARYEAHARFLLLDAPQEVREARAHSRHSNDPGGLALALDRIRGDITQLYDVLLQLTKIGEPVFVIDTTKSVDLDEVLA